MKRLYSVLAVLCINFWLSQTFLAIAQPNVPFNACSFYTTRLVVPSFGAGAPWAGCAQFSAVRGRQACTKIKGVCPACVKYQGDHVQMWLPDYFIELTKHIGQSSFALSPDGTLLAKHLKIGLAWWNTSNLPLGSFSPLLSNGSQTTSGKDSFWHARILTVPYGGQFNSYSPVAAGLGSGMPGCFLGLSEFLPAQWNTNLSDGPFAHAWSPIGAPLCLSIVGGGILGGLAEAKAAVGTLGASSGGGNFETQSCASPVGVKEGFAKNSMGTSDALSPLGDITKLCMGTWGNLLPRTGWITSEDPHMSAMLAAYKFMSLVGDFHLNAAAKLRFDDKWQIVYPPRDPASTCFTPGSPLKDLPLPSADNVFERGLEEMKIAGNLKNHTYVIAVWRKRDSCEEPLSLIGGWNVSYKAQLAKNTFACKGVYTK